jgi:hypothetical protein
MSPRGAGPFASPKDFYDSISRINHCDLIFINRGNGRKGKGNIVPKMTVKWSNNIGPFPDWPLTDLPFARPARQSPRAVKTSGVA